MNDKCIVWQNNFYYYFNIYSNLSWRIERILWIAYYKNDQNDQCLIDYLPKDILITIIAFLRGSIFHV